jgi:hypothetical protein
MDRRARIIALNDDLRTTFKGGRIQIMPALYELDDRLRGRALSVLALMGDALVPPVMAIATEQIWIALVGSLSDECADQRRQPALWTARMYKPTWEWRGATAAPLVS